MSHQESFDVVFRIVLLACVFAPVYMTQSMGWYKRHAPAVVRKATPAKRTKKAKPKKVVRYKAPPLSAYEQALVDNYYINRQYITT